MFSAIASILGKVYQSNDNPNSLYVHDDPLLKNEKDKEHDPYLAIKSGWPSYRARPGDVIVDAELGRITNFLSDFLGRPLSGLRVTAEEMTIMHKGIRNACAIPDMQLWANAGPPLECIYDELRQECGFPIFFANGFRPRDYNAKVGGDSGSMHMNFSAFDLEPYGRHNTLANRRKMMKILAKIYKDQGKRIKMGLGIYGSLYNPTRFHIDCGQRPHRANWGVKVSVIK